MSSHRGGRALRGGGLAGRSDTLRSYRPYVLLPNVILGILLTCSLVMK